MDIAGIFYLKRLSQRKEKLMKMPQEEGVYVESDEHGEYKCEACSMWRKDSTCSHVEGEIKSFGSCNIWHEKETDEEMEDHPMKLKKNVATYVENEDGFTCSRCEAWMKESQECQWLEGEIKEKGCCIFWTNNKAKYGED